MVNQRSNRARASLLTYFALLTPLTLLGYWLWITRNEHQALVFTPTVAMVGTRLLRKEGFGDVSFRLGTGRKRAYGAAVLAPLVICAVAYVGGWAAGLVGFEPAALPKPFPNLNNPYAQFAWTVLLSLTIVTLFFAPLAAGEEFGWRGHMLPRMVDAGIPRPLLASAFIWALWHVPLILSAAYKPGSGAPVPASLIFIASALGYGWFLGRLRLASGSVWPCVLAHSAWNALTQACFNPAVKPMIWPWLGESGVLVAAVIAIVVIAAGYRLPIKTTVGGQITT